MFLRKHKTQLSQAGDELAPSSETTWKLVPSTCAEMSSMTFRTLTEGCNAESDVRSLYIRTRARDVAREHPAKIVPLASISEETQPRYETARGPAYSAHAALANLSGNPHSADSWSRM